MVRLRKAYKILTVPEYQEWLEAQTLKERVQIAKRLQSIELEGYFGDHKYLTDHIWELKWKNGRRVYYAYIEQINIMLLLGGNKNGQQKDIVKSKRLLKKYVEPKT